MWWAILRDDNVHQWPRPDYESAIEIWKHDYFLLKAQLSSVEILTL